jgi:predicted PurR-regulated permease PerM
LLNGFSQKRTHTSPIGTTSGTEKELKPPFYAKVTIILIGLFVLTWILFYTQAIIVPLIFSMILAILLHPAVLFFQKLKINRVVAILITLTLAFAILTAVGIFIISQASMFGEAWPKMVEKFTDLLNNLTSWASGYFDISPRKITTWISQAKDELIDIPTIGHTLISVGSSMFLLILIPVYIFMLLFYQPLLLEFLFRLFGTKNQPQMSEIIQQIKTLIQRYLLGLIIEAVLIAILNSIGLFALGIEYAILIGIIGALLNIIPYLGGIVGVAIPMVIALITKPSPLYPLYVLAVYYFIQLIDNNYIVPMIVASRVKINALVSIITVLAFGALWGIPGMFLSIPITAIIKLIFDHIEQLKPWGFLLGDDIPTIGMIRFPTRKKKSQS